MGKKVMIIFEETGGAEGREFKTYIEGLSKDAGEMSEEEQTVKLSPAEFWGLRTFQVIKDMMIKTGMLQSVQRKEGSINTGRGGTA